VVGPEDVAQNIPGGRDDLFESPVGNAHRDSQNVNLLRLLLESPCGELIARALLPSASQ
jgi:hypothetical protein